MSVIIITPPPKKPESAEPGELRSNYDIARDLIDQAEVQGIPVRIMRGDAAKAAGVAEQDDGA